MKKWCFYTSNEIKPKGWIKKQLQIQADGLAGNLDRVWRDVRNSKWIGGDAEGWERVPYWLDGFIPLAYLLDDENMVDRAKRYVESIIESQQDDGWICPCKIEERKGYDAWAVLLISKVLCVYYECSNDDSVLNVIYRILKNFYELLSKKEIKLFDWGKYRWFECFIAINLIYEKYQEDWLVDLARILKKQGTNYKKLTNKWKWPRNKWCFDTHIVNIAMMLKSEAISHNILNEDYSDSAQKLFDILYRYNGTPVGLFTGDECLSGLSPIQGTELCSVVEQMYSYELLYAYTGDSKWAERLELLAFNALPASVSDDMWTHQYVQMSNQIACQKLPGKSLFRTNNGEAHLFGLEPHFGCCTANFGQGFPKFVISAFMHSKESVINVLPIASELKTKDKHIIVESDYPFNNSIRYNIVSQIDFIFKIRIPSFAEKVMINNELFDEKEYTVQVKADENISISLSFDTTPYFDKGPSGLSFARCGSLVFSLPIKHKKTMYEYEKDGVERKYPYCDYEYIPETEWSFAYCSDKLIKEHREIREIPFSSDNPPIILKAKVKKIDWGYENGFETVCSKFPHSNEPKGKEQDIVLYPYGCAKLRMTELNMIK